MSPEYLPSLANHLWQSTLFAGAAGILTLLLRNNHARVRHGVWLAASCKFLVPFAVLLAMGGQIRWRSAPAPTSSNWSAVVEQISQPVSSPVLPRSAPSAVPIPEILLGVWACGFLFISASWWLRWRRMQAIVRSGSPVQMEIPIRAVRSHGSLEPGVFGVFRPVLLLPEGISERLSPDQLKAVIEHELCHVRHRDNLIAALQMLIETIFWFHPLIWWMGKRMAAERERACDEEVLRLGNEPRVYAEGILSICRSYLSSPLPCASGVGGSDLNGRIRAIVANRPARHLGMRGRIFLIVSATVALIGPVAVGTFSALPVRSQTRTETTTSAFEAASVKPHQDTGRRNRARNIEPERITCLDITLRELILMAYDVKPYQISGPDWIQDMRYDVVATAGKPVGIQQVKHMLGPLLVERFHLLFHRETRELPVFALVIAKGGPKFKDRGDGGEIAITQDGSGGLFFKNYSMEDLADWLTLPSVSRPVIDRTGLSGTFSFRANLFALDKATGQESLKTAMVSADAADTLRVTLPEQLGLRLESQKAPVEHFVIDRADKVPTEN